MPGKKGYLEEEGLWDDESELQKEKDGQASRNV